MKVIVIDRRNGIRFETVEKASFVSWTSQFRDSLSFGIGFGFVGFVVKW